MGDILYNFSFFGFLTAAFQWLLGLLLTALLVAPPIGLGLMAFGKFLRRRVAAAVAGDLERRTAGAGIARNSA